MQKDLKNFSPEDATHLANTPIGKQLISLLQNSDSNIIRNAMDQANKGNINAAKTALEPLLNSPEIRKALEMLGGK